MALRRSNLAALVLIVFVTPAVAEDSNTNYASRSDFVSLSAGDASRSNMAIQHPTPWPSYVNDTKFHTPARQGVSSLEKMFKRYEGGSSSGPSTDINVGNQ